MKPDFPRDTDAQHAADLAERGEDGASRMLQLRQGLYFNRVGKRGAAGARKCVDLVLEITEGMTLTGQQQARLNQLEAEATDLEEAVAEDPQPENPQPSGGRGGGRA
jgi:hypothetical protein